MSNTTSSTPRFGERSVIPAINLAPIALGSGIVAFTSQSTTHDMSGESQSGLAGNETNDSSAPTASTLGKRTLSEYSQSLGSDDVADDKQKSVRLLGATSTGARGGTIPGGGADGEKGEEEVIKEFHADFEDPAADIILKSQDGSYFRVSSWHLARHW
jgi:hypothetical protein